MECRVGDTVKLCYEGVLEGFCKEHANGYLLKPGYTFTVEVIKHVYSIGDTCDYQGAKHVVAAIVDGYYVLSAPGLKPRLLAI